MIGTKITRQNPDAMHLSFFPADFPPLKVIWGVLESLYSDYFFIFLENWRQPLKTWAMLLNPTPHVGLYGLCMIKIYHLWHMKFPAPITTIGFFKKKKNREIHKKSNHANPNERRVAFLGRWWRRQGPIESSFPPPLKSSEKVESNCICTV